MLVITAAIKCNVTRLLSINCVILRCSTTVSNCIKQAMIKQIASSNAISAQAEGQFFHSQSGHRADLPGVAGYEGPFVPYCGTARDG